MEKVTSHVWKWFDIVSGKWCPYTVANNKIIDDAFWAGQNSVRVTAGRRRYLLQFSSMIQVNCFQVSSLEISPTNSAETNLIQ